MKSRASKYAERAARVLRDLRGNRSQKAFALELGVKQPTLHRYEHGRMPPAEFLLRVSEVCGMSMERIMTGRETDTGAGKMIRESSAGYEMPPELRNLIEELSARPGLISAIRSVLSRKEGGALMEALGGLTDEQVTAILPTARALSGR